MSAISMKVNGKAVCGAVEPRTLLVEFLRENLGLTGTHVGCDTSQCGACVVHVDGRAIKSCTVLAASCDGAAVTTIEGLASGGALTAVQQAWVTHQVPQCGYCQSGMIMAVTALLAERPNPGDEEIDAAITNICRCGTFARVRRAIHAVAQE